MEQKDLSKCTEKIDLPVGPYYTFDLQLRQLIYGNHMRRFTILAAVTLFVVTTAYGQNTEFGLDIPPGEFTAPYTVGLQSGSRAVSGPFDMDGDGKAEVLFSDYTGGGRVHVVENVDGNTWELVYSTPLLDSTATTTYNGRYAYGTNATADFDNDGKGEIIIPAGRSYSATNPNTRQGLYIFEYTGTDNDYGAAPASVIEVEEYARLETKPVVDDLDGDGTIEILFPNNGTNAFDHFYIYSVNGDIGSGFETWVQELKVEPRVQDLGGGSPYSVYYGDFDGDGNKEMLLQTWNNYNVFFARATGANTYEVEEGKWRHVDPNSDSTPYTGGAVVDINGDGDDELYTSLYCCGAGPDYQHRPFLFNLEEGESAADTVRQDWVTLGLLEEAFIWGTTVGDLDGDGAMEIMGVGQGYSLTDYNAKAPSSFLRIAEFTGGQGGDPEDPDNYQVYDLDTSHPADSAGFNTIERDSLGTMTTYYEGGGIFGFRVEYLGDADNDGENEVAISFQSVPDSVYTISEVWNADSLKYFRTTTSVAAASPRVFGRILSGKDFSVGTQEDVIVLPSDYKILGNYPNPFAESTTMRYELPLDKAISIKVYDISGRLVRTLVDNELTAKGVHEVVWDGRGANGAAVASGTYLYSLEYGNFRQSKSMVLVK